MSSQRSDWREREEHSPRSHQLARRKSRNYLRESLSPRRLRDSSSKNPPRERADPGHSSFLPGPDRVSKHHDNGERPGRYQNRPLWKGPATQPGRSPLLAPTMARSRYAQGRDCHAQELGSKKTPEVRE